MKERSDSISLKELCAVNSEYEGITVINPYRDVLIDELFAKSKEQLDTYSRIIAQLKDIDYSKRLSDDNEAVLSREFEDGLCLLVIDEYGGLTSLIIGKLGKGYEAKYFEYEEITQDVILTAISKFTNSKS